MNNKDAEEWMAENGNEENGLVELPEEYGGDEIRGKQIITLLTIIAAAANIIVFAIPWEFTGAIDIVGLTLSVLILIGILLLGLFWKPKPEQKNIVNVSSISASVGTQCSPNGSKRTARQAGTPATTGWTVVRTFTQKSLAAQAKKYVPSTRFLTYGFIEVSRTLNYTCQDQVCQNGAWANSGASYQCNVVQKKTFQVFGGPTGQAPLQGWTDQAIRQSYDSGYYQ